MNQRLALDVLKNLIASGVTEFCVCPGARNSPLIDLLLQHPELRRWHFFEERSAAFFALGRIKQTDHPVAVVTTSGTAAGELLPAAMEAHYSSLPLLLLTADRPRRFRGSGAPQTAEQVGIYGVYAESSVDVSESESFDLSAWSRRRPFHLNVCFEEPLLDASASDAVKDFIASPLVRPLKPVRIVEDIRTDELTEFLKKTQRPLVIVGSLPPSEREGVKQFLAAYRAPTYFEAHSGLREDKALLSFRVHGSDGILGRAQGAGYEIDGVLRIGGVPTLRLWRDLEIQGGKIPVCSISTEPFSGLSWANVLTASPGTVLSRLQPSVSQGAEAFLETDHSLQDRIRALFHQEPLSEPTLFHQLSRSIPTGSRVFLGNSLPIREWDLAATFASRDFEIGASRGLNGIDGQLSTFYGFAESGRENWAILGDLTTMYDLPGPWILPQLPRGTKTNLVIVNNRGGKIFSRMFGPQEFQNPHHQDFAAWAKFWKVPYEAWDAIPDGALRTESHRIIELRPDEAASARFWKSYDALWKTGLPPSRA